VLQNPFSPAAHADSRLPEIENLLAGNSELALAADSYDAATIILTYHDRYWSSQDYGWELVDVPAFLAELYKGHKAWRSARYSRSPGR